MTTAALARALAANIHNIARHQHAGQFLTELEHAVTAVDRTINRPIPPRYCGPCPTQQGGTHCGTRHERTGELQRTALLAPREATQITCHTCGITHDIAEIERKLWDEVGQWLLTPAEILLVMDYFGEPIAESTFRRWRAKGKIPARGHRNGKPRYWIADIRPLRNQRKAK